MIDKSYMEYVENKSAHDLYKISQRIDRKKCPDNYDYVMNKLSEISNENLDSIPNYEAYSIENLEAELGQINAEIFPVRSGIIEEVLEKKKISIKNEEESFVKKNYLNLRSFIAYYHILFGGWAVILLVQILSTNPGGIFFSIPLIFFITSSLIGGARLITDKKGGINYLITAQVPQLLTIQLNGFFYQFLCGQWIMLNIISDETMFYGFNFGLLNVSYTLTLESNLPANGVGINLLSIILISILLRMEELGSK